MSINKEVYDYIFQPLYYNTKYTFMMFLARSIKKFDNKFTDVFPGDILSKIKFDKIKPNEKCQSFIKFVMKMLEMDMNDLLHFCEECYTSIPDYKIDPCEMLFTVINEENKVRILDPIQRSLDYVEELKNDGSNGAKINTDINNMINIAKLFRTLKLNSSFNILYLKYSSDLFMESGVLTEHGVLMKSNSL